MLGPLWARKVGLSPTVGQGISTVVGFPAVCNAGISISGGTNVAYANRDVFEDSSDTGVTGDESFAVEIDQEALCAKEVSAQYRLLNVSDLELPIISGVVDLEGHQAGAK